MMKKIVIAGLAALALIMAHDARAAGNDSGGFTDSHFSDSAAGGLQDPPTTSTDTADAAAAAAAGIEPAAGGSENVFTTTQVGNASPGPAQPTARAPGADDDSMTMSTVYP